MSVCSRDVNGEYFPTVFEFDLVRKGFYLSVSDSEYLLSVTDPYPNAQKLYFYDVDIHYNLIRQKLILSVSTPYSNTNMKTNTISVISVRIQSVFIPKPNARA